jgi:hypothetical protein
MSGLKNKGDLVNRLSAPGEFDPKGSRINFSDSVTDVLSCSSLNCFSASVGVPSKPKRSKSPYFPLIEQLIFFPSKHILNRIQNVPWQVA